MRFHLLVAVALALTVGGVVQADEIRDALDQSTEAYENDVAAIEAQVDQDLGELFDSYADKGDLEKAQKVEQIRERFATEGLLPDDPLLRTIREKARIRFGKANREMRTAYLSAIAAYTRARELPAAEEVKRSLDGFEKQQAANGLAALRAIKTPMPIVGKWDWGLGQGTAEFFEDGTGMHSRGNKCEWTLSPFGRQYTIVWENGDIDEFEVVNRGLSKRHRNKETKDWIEGNKIRE